MDVLIGLSGKPRSGKDTIGAYLEQSYGFKTYAFADYLKYLIMKYYGIDKATLWGTKTDLSRLLLHGTGLLLNEEVSQTILIEPVVTKIKEDYEKAQESGQPFRAVIMDVRRDEEAELLNRSSAYFLCPDEILDTGVRLRNIFDRMALVLVNRNITHISSDRADDPIESFPDRNEEWDYYISNEHTGSKQDLYTSVDSMMSELLGKQEVIEDAGNSG